MRKQLFRKIIRYKNSCSAEEADPPKQLIGRKYHPAAADSQKHLLPDGIFDAGFTASCNRSVREIHVFRGLFHMS